MCRVAHGYAHDYDFPVVLVFYTGAFVRVFYVVKERLWDLQFVCQVVEFLQCGALDVDPAMWLPILDNSQAVLSVDKCPHRQCFFGVKPKVPVRDILDFIRV